jgi:hypothetical protein
MSQVVEAFLSSLIVGLPQIVIATVGLMLVHTRLKRLHPRAYLFGNIGLVLLLVNALWSAVSRAYIQAYIAQVQDRLAFASKLTLANLAGFVILIASLAFILAATLADRDPARGSRGAA